MSLKFFLPLLIVLSGIAYFTVPAVEFVTSRWFERDLDARSKIISDALQESLAPLLAQRSADTKKKKVAVISKMTENERVLAIGYCDVSNVLEIRTNLFPDELQCRDFVGKEAHALVVKELKNGIFHVTTAPLTYDYEEKKLDGTTSTKTFVGRLLIVHDMSFAARRTRETQRYLFMMFLGIGLVTAIIGVIIARWSMKGWIRSVRSLVTGAQSSDINSIENKEFMPILQDVKNLIRELETNRATRDDFQLSWTPQSLKEILSTELSGDEILVVSNRQPYIHMKEDGGIKIQFPASGLVTAIEPVVRACSGVWIAHGNGTADREVVDKRDRAQVPPGKNEYEIHRIWLTPEEEKGYYYGFSNEGLWPLCHIAHTRPIFRQSDWESYKQVNQKFANAVIADAKSDNPVVLVQDYHLALVPKMIRDKLPNATIITFWHVPWPNPEAFGICPWREEILEGLLGSSIVGFHIRFHRNNFVETVDRFLESRIDREYSSISYLGRATLVRSYPISIEWPPHLLADIPPIVSSREIICTSKVLPRDDALSF
jgi:trehalose 6-phosphate synthase